MKIYIDTDYKCHATNDGTRREFDLEAMDGKCKAYIEGYRYVPDGETWTRDDGVEFKGAMLSPYKNYAELEAAQATYEEARAEIADMQTALGILGVE